MTFVAGFRCLDTGEQAVVNYVYDADLLTWVPQLAGGGGGTGSDVNVTNPSLAVTQSGAWGVSVNNFPASQAVTGPLTDTQLRATAVPVSAASLPLPSGAASETTLAALNTKIPALGQAVMASSSPVVIASNQSAVPVSGTFWQATQPVSASSLPLPTGAATETTLSALNGKFGSLGQKAMTGSAPVVLASDQSAVPTTPPLPNTGTRTSVTAAASDTSLLASNTSRRGATVYNDGSTTLYLALGTAAASTTSYTCQVAPGGYYETPFNFTGAIRGIWAGSPTGSARITELT